jgi:aromatic ring-opening dioxygenase catalytic subunit (LigB family)
LKYKAQTLFLSHGGGPMPLLGDASHQEMIDCLQKITTKINKPSVIILISAHWEENIPTITSGLSPNLIYDYYGFPEESYNIKYPCIGKPLLAKQIQKVLVNAGIEAKLDEHRGFDHGVFVPLIIMFPEADIPCVQLSLVKSLSASEHLNIGKALRSLEVENLLVIGSGFTFHNIKAFFASETIEANAMNEAFESWLIKTCSSVEISESERAQRLINWENAPSARYCHPREEHLLPLHVCYGFAQAPCSEYFELSVLNKKTSMYRWAAES